MAVTRADLGRGPAHVTIGGVTLYTRDDIVPRHAPVWNPVPTSMYGEVDKFKSDLVIRFNLNLWGAWESLAVLFPTALLNPTVGASLFSGADAPVEILARNGDKITYHNARITKLSDLYLGVDSELFASSVEITALLKNTTEPEAANAYYTIATAQAYTDSAFAKTNFKKARFTGAWGAKAGFTAIVPQKGFHVGWNLALTPVKVDGYGTVDFTVGGMTVGCKCLPIQPTLAQIESMSNAQGSAMGSLLSVGTAAAADLTLSSAAAPAATVVLKNANMVEHGYAFGVEPLRVGEMGWETTRAFAIGVPAALATVA